jgi:hypothetical protein
MSVATSGLRHLDYAVLGGYYALLRVPEPLYSGTQQTYFIHGLSETGRGVLREDWLAGTADPFPAFSALVDALAQAPHALFIVYLALYTLYFGSLLHLATTLTNFQGSRTEGYILGLVLAFSQTQMLGHVAPPLEWLPYTLTTGVAGQFLISTVLQPSISGLFLLLSLGLFVDGHRYGAVVAACIAAGIHASFALPAALLIAGYMAALHKQDGRWQTPLLVGSLGFLILLPTLLYSLTTFAPTSTETLRQAQRILVEQRLPHHALPSVWFGWIDLVKLGLIGAAAFVVRRRRTLLVLVPLVVVGVGGTLLQVVTGSYGLALLFPWRVSVVLVPLAGAVLIAALFQYTATYLKPQQQQARRLLILTFGALALAAGTYKLTEQVERFTHPFHPLTPLEQYVAETAASGDLYLIPVGYEEFRLRTMAPTFVDFKSHPYRDVEVLEWAKRIEQARAFFAAEGTEACRQLDALVAAYGITHVVVRAPSPIRGCARLEDNFIAAGGGIYRVRSE